jgi:hypothetical protein
MRGDNEGGGFTRGLLESFIKMRSSFLGQLFFRKEVVAREAKGGNTLIERAILLFVSFFSSCF